MTISEPKIVIENREHLWILLSEALQLQHMIMCQYLFAQFSLKDGIRDGLTAEQADAVDRWRKMVHGIAIEEMLHMALVGNLMFAIGAAPNFGRPNFPQRSGYSRQRCDSTCCRSARRCCVGGPGAELGRLAG
jgi:hypothetical protein